jgi:threo-3-hydroxy-L-aspartate ammonia-lyase
MKTLREAIRPTTFIRSVKLNEYLNIDLTVVSETFQHTGSFKFRAAYNVAAKVSEDHLITASSGNFGQALAYACRLLGKKCHVVMPETSAQVKIDAVRGFGATVDLIDVKQTGREMRVSELLEEFPGAYRASAFDDPLVIEGNSSLGEEINGCGEKFDCVLVPVGGAGLISGIAESFRRNNFETRLVGAEPSMANDASRSLQAGKIVKNESEPQTIADGARTVSVGENNWKIIRDGVEEIIEVSEENIKAAVRLYFVLANLKAEPTGALSLAAILERQAELADKKICCVVSGGNVDPAIYREILS